MHFLLFFRGWRAGVGGGGGGVGSETVYAMVSTAQGDRKSQRSLKLLWSVSQKETINICSTDGKLTREAEELFD